MKLIKINESFYNTAHIWKIEQTDRNIINITFINGEYIETVNGEISQLTEFCGADDVLTLISHEKP